MDEGREREAAGSRSRGVLYALGLGPGNPGLVTVRAAELLRRCPVVAFPVDRAGSPGRAYRTAAPYLAGDRVELPLRMPMTDHGPTLAAAWEHAVGAIAEHTAAGRDVAYLCLGDTLLYGSFGYLLSRYDGQVEVVPGVISPVAAASVIGVPLVEGREPLMVVPDGADLGLLRRALDLGGTVVLMKPSRLGAEGIALLEASGALSRAWVTVDVSLGTQRVFPVRAAAEIEALPYFSILTVLPTRSDGDRA